MNIVRSTSALLGTLTLSATLAHGQAFLTFTDTKNFRIVGPEESDYEGGSLRAVLNDGSITFLPCGANLFPFFIPPSLGCASGTTGLITQSNFDFDGDGVRDSGFFTSVAQPIPAIQVEPFQTSLISLFSAPPSELSRPLGGFAWTDTSTIIFFDEVNNPRNATSFEITQYSSNRPYTALELNRHRDEVVPGSYLFEFPALGSSEDNPSSVFINIGHREMVEAFPGPGGRSVTSGGISVGNDFRTTNDDLWSNGVMEVDPRNVSIFNWEGFNGVTFLASDRLFFAVRDRFTDLIVFPPFPPGTARGTQLISGNGLPIVNEYELGPTFFGVGQEVYVELEFRRNLAVGNTIDTSVRFFRWDVNMIDSFDGFVVGAFPLGSLDSEVAADFDFDDDGFTNLEEFGLQTDPTDPASVPNPITMIDEFTGHCELVIPKRPFVGSRLVYTIEYSFDLEVWFTIDENDPNWFLVTDDEDEIAVFSRQPATVNPCFTRVRLTQN